MYLEGKKILSSETVLTTRRKRLSESFDIDVRHILDAAECSDEELLAKLIERHTMEPLVILPTAFAGQGFHVVHKGVAGLTERFFAFNRDVPYTGDKALWSFSTAKSGIADLRMRFSARRDATIHGICTEAECETVDIYLERKMYDLRKFVLPVAGRHVEIHNGIVAESAAAFLRRFELSIHRYRRKAAEERRMAA